jgi:hypothetical protein
MSVVVEEMPELVGAYTPKYPWGLWLDGRVHRLTEGEDFDQPIINFASNVHAYARRHGAAVTTRVRGEHLYVQAILMRVKAQP